MLLREKPVLREGGIEGRTPAALAGMPVLKGTLYFVRFGKLCSAVLLIVRRRSSSLAIFSTQLELKPVAFNGEVLHEIAELFVSQSNLRHPQFADETTSFIDTKADQ